MTIRTTVRSNHFQADNQGFIIDQSNTFDLKRAVFTRLAARLKLGGYLSSPSRGLCDGVVSFTALLCWFHRSPSLIFFGLGLQQSSGNNCLCIWSTSLAVMFRCTVGAGLMVSLGFVFVLSDFWSTLGRSSVVAVWLPFLRLTNQVNNPSNSFCEAPSSQVLTPLNSAFLELVAVLSADRNEATCCFFFVFTSSSPSPAWEAVRFLSDVLFIRIRLRIVEKKEKNI